MTFTKGYSLHLMTSELEALAWIANRYESANVLYDGMELVNPGEGAESTDEYHVEENVAWDYHLALEEEDGNCLVPPCCGGTLAEKLLSFCQEIV